MTLKKLFLAAMASVLVSTGMQAQVENFEIFRHVGGNLNVGRRVLALMWQLPSPTTWR